MPGLLDRIRVFLSETDPALLAVLGLAALGLVVFLILSPRRVEWLLLVMVTSSAFVGSSSAILDSVAALTRWAAIGLLFVIPLVRRGPFFRGGVLLFVIHAICGFLFLLNAVSLEWQIQRALLLMATAVAVPSATIVAAGDSKSAKRLFMEIGVIGSVVVLVSAVQLPAQMATVGRFTGASQGVPHYAMVLGSLIPFVFLGMWGDTSRIVRTLYATMFLIGAFCLLITAQRAGTLGGVIGITPLLIALGLSKKIRIVVVGILGALIVFLVISNLDETRLKYIQSRYEPKSGLSNRDVVWAEAYGMIMENVLLGHGTGAAENTRTSESSFHNAYLEAWFNGGLLGLLCFVGAQLRVLYVTFWLGRYGPVELKKEITLASGVVLGICFVGFFESSPAGASTILVLTFLVVAAVMESQYRNMQASKAQSRSTLPLTIQIEGQPSALPKVLR
jgi:O-antigen ligase